jgi:hypothetical protein
MANPPSEKSEIVQFLFEQRMALFNLRRDHEWKIFFGVIGLIGGVDVALITNSIHLPPWGMGCWRAMLAVLFVSNVMYEFGVQTRNRVDRIVMEGLYRILCDSAAIPDSSEVRLPVDASAQRHLGRPVQPIMRYTFLWAFIWQTIVLFVVCAISWFLPDFVTTTP